MSRKRVSMLVQLYSGHIQGGPELDAGATADQIDCAVMLVYEGTFDSMDGKVTITADHLAELAKHHNRKHALQLAGGDVPMRDCPPVQLDHSTSARDTVGRLIGPVHTDTVVIEGAPRLALLGTVRFLGAENVQKAKDGRYTHVSIGADLEANTLKELSVTPFPAAAKASLLTQGAPAMDKEKLKKHLMRSTKCSAEEAEEKLAKMSDDEQAKLAAEADDEDKKLAAEEEEKAKLAAEEEEKKKDLAEGKDGDGDKDDEKDGPKKLAAANDKIAKLTGALGRAKTALAAQRVTLRQAEIGNRIAKLRASGQLTPAEQKKLMEKAGESGSFVTRLAAAPDDTMALVFDVLEAREPVVAIGQLGSLKAVDLAAGGGALKQARLAEGMKDVLDNMPFTKKALAAGGGDVQLSADPQVIAPQAQQQEPATPVVDDALIAKLRDNDKRLSGLIDEITAAL
jgi:hypothetical protein